MVDTKSHITIDNVIYDATYRTILGIEYNLALLTREEADLFKELYRLFKTNPKFGGLGSQIINRYKAINDTPTADKDPLWIVLEDLNMRLGISQACVAAPDYRDTTAEILNQLYPGLRDIIDPEGGKNDDADYKLLNKILYGRRGLDILMYIDLLRRFNFGLIVVPQSELLKFPKELYEKGEEYKPEIVRFIPYADAISKAIGYAFENNETFCRLSGTDPNILDDLLNNRNVDVVDFVCVVKRLGLEIKVLPLANLEEYSR